MKEDATHIVMDVIYSVRSICLNSETMPRNFAKICEESLRRGKLVNKLEIF